MATIAEKSHTLDGVTYTTKTFPAGKAIRLGARIARLIDVDAWRGLLGLEWSKLAKLMDSGLETEGADDETISFAMVLLDGFVAAASRAAPEEFEALCRDLLENTTCDNIANSGSGGSVKAHFDSHFAGRLDHLGKVVFWVAHVGFTGP